MTARETLEFAARLKVADAPGSPVVDGRGPAPAPRDPPAYRRDADDDDGAAVAVDVPRAPPRADGAPAAPPHCCGGGGRGRRVSAAEFGGLDRAARVAWVLGALGLAPCADLPVSQLSGGRRAARRALERAGARARRARVPARERVGRDRRRVGASAGRAGLPAIYRCGCLGAWWWYRLCGARR